MQRSKFWLENPKVLFTDVKVLPNQQDDINDKLNTLTKLVIIIAIVLALFGWRYWLVFLIVALLIILLIYLINQNQNSSNTTLREQFDEDLNNFTYYSNNLEAPKKKSPKVKSEIKEEFKEIEVDNGITLMTDLELKLKPLSECYRHIKASESLTPPDDLVSVTYIEIPQEVKTVPAQEVPKVEPMFIPEMPKPNVVIQTKQTRKNAPQKKVRMTAAELAKESAINRSDYDGIDHDEIERRNMINALI